MNTVQHTQQGNLTRLEHANITVVNPDELASKLCTLFDWRIRWAGDAIHGGRSVHVGTDDFYLALYRPGSEAKDKASSSYDQVNGLNHIGLVVDDLDAVLDRVRKAGYSPHGQEDYDPGRRFYFYVEDGLEFEMVSYAGKSST